MNKQKTYENMLKLKEQKLTSLQIANDLNSKNIKTIKGLEWTAALVSDFFYKQKKNVKKLTNLNTKINIKLNTKKDLNSDVKELAQDIKPSVIENVIENKSTVIESVIDTHQNDIENVIDTHQNDIENVIESVIENKSISFEKAYTTLIQHIDCLYQEIEILRNKIAVIENKSSVIDNVIENKSSVIESVIENKSSVIDVIDNKIGKWSIQCSKGNYMAFKRINGKVKSIYIGKNINLAKQKIEAKGFDIN